MTAMLILTTGGTIDKLYFDDQNSYGVGESVAGRLLSIARSSLSVTIREILRKDSLAIDDNDRLAIAEAVLTSADDRIVITHGTDTMTDTADALSGVRGKTIVLTGALSPARFAESDASFNLGMAFATAQIAAPGVYITMNGQVFEAGQVRKDRTAATFVSVK